VLRLTDSTKFEFGASFEVLWLKSPTSPSPKPLAGMHKLGQTKKYKLSEKEFVSVI
jgi:hypothetical protein